MAKDALQVKKATKGRVTCLRLVGTLDRNFDATEIIEAVDGKDVILNLAGLRFAGTHGTSSWVRTVEAMSDRAARLVFVDCSRAVVTELNLSAELTEKVTVFSVQVRHACKRCNSISKVSYSFEGKQEYSKHGIKHACVRCGGPTVVDENLQTYLEFRHRTQLRPVDADLRALVDDLATVEGKEITLTETSTEAARGREVTGWRRWQRMSLVGGGATIAAIGIILWVALAPRAPEDQLPIFEAHLQAGRIEAAERLLLEMESSDAIAASTTADSRTRLEAAKEKGRNQMGEQILQLFRDGRYGEILDLVEQQQEWQSSSVHVAFAVAESYRFANRLEEAAPHYGEVVASPDAGRKLDDAMFWRAESLLLSGETAEATTLFERVIELRRSDFVKSAKRRLASIREDEQ